MKLQVYRTNASSYQDHHFFQQEKVKLEQIEGVKYLSSLKEISDELPFVLLTNTHTRPEELPAPMLEKTLLMIHPNSGYDNFDINFVQEARFPIVTGNPIRSHAVVEYVLSCIFHHYTSIPHHVHWSNSRKWDRKLLRDQKVMILGYGHIGKILSESLRPLCRELTIFDPYIHSDSDSKQNVTQTWKDELLDGVQILIIASGLNKSNHQFLNLPKLKRLDSECLIINAARGELIHEPELVQFLKKKPAVQCYLDVFTQEPFTPGHLHDLKNLNKTSHIAGVHSQLNQDIIEFEYQVIKDFIHFQQDQLNESFEDSYKHCLLKNRIIDHQII